MTRYQIQVFGQWADLMGGWRPAITDPATGTPGEEVSTYPTHDDAQANLDHLVNTELSEEAAERGLTRFRIVEVQ